MVFFGSDAMKLTLAMGVQFDNGKQASMVALNLGRDKQPSMQPGQQPVEAGVVRSAPMQGEIDQGGTDATPFNQSSIMPVRQIEPLFFLTYNLQGLNDTLVFENTLVDVYV